MNGRLRTTIDDANSTNPSEPTMASASSKLPTDVKERQQYLRTHVSLHADHVASVTSTDFPGTFPGEDLSWNLDSFKSNFSLRITRVDGNDMEFDMIGVDAAVANAFRRILIAEVPTMAIERVYSLQNTGIVQDEVFAQRLGLVPIAADPREFEWGG